MTTGVTTYSIDQAGFFELLDEGDECSGGSNPPVYADQIPIGCVNEGTLEEVVTEASIRGGNKVCKRASRLDEVTVNIKHVGLNPDLVAAARAFVLTAFSSGGVDGWTLVRNFGSNLVRGAIIMRAPDPDGTGDLHIIIPNIEFTTGPGAGFADDTWFESNFGGHGDNSLYAPCLRAYWFNAHTNGIVDIPTVWPGETDY